MAAQSAAAGNKLLSPDETPRVLQETIARFKSTPSAVSNLQGVAQKQYSVFCRHRTAELYTTFLALVESPIDFFREANFMAKFNAAAPFSGRAHERPVSGMATAGSVMHGVVRYEYKGCLIEECRKDGKPHGLRVVCTQHGDIWIRLHSEGQRLAQVVLTSGYSIAANPKPIDDGGLEGLLSHLHLIRECFESN